MMRDRSRILRVTEHATITHVDFERYAFGAVSEGVPAGWQFIRGTSARVCDYFNGVVSGVIAANVPRIGVTVAGRKGLRLEPSTINKVSAPRDLTAAAWQPGSLATVTANAGTSPDGTTSADRVQVSATGYGPWWDMGANSNNGSLLTYWVRAYTGTLQQQHHVQSNTQDFAGVTSIDTNWKRVVARILGGATTQKLYPVDGRDLTAIGGIAAHAEDVLIDCVQIEQPYAVPTDFIDGSRSDEGLVCKLPVAINGRIGLELELTYNTSSVLQPISWVAYSNANNYVQHYGSPRSIVVRVAGTDFTVPTTFAWNDGDVLKLWVEAGGGALRTRVAIARNGTKIVDNTSTSPQGTWPAGDIGVCSTLPSPNGASWCTIHRVAFYKPGRRPSWV